MEEITSIVFNGITITEPVTAFTNAILSALGLFFYYAINKHCPKNKFNNYWSYFFLFFGLATGVGIIVHGASFYTGFGTPLFKTIKLIMNLLNMIGIFFSVKATLAFAAYKPVIEKRMNLLFVSMLLLFSFLTIVVNFLKMPANFNNFIFVTINAAISLIFILLVHYRSYKAGNKSCGYILFGIGISFVTVYIHTAKISISEWFNHKDISHIIMMISIYYIYRGVMAKRIPNSN